jgi:hypothetical protein
LGDPERLGASAVSETAADNDPDATSEIPARSSLAAADPASDELWAAVLVACVTVVTEGTSTEVVSGAVTDALFVNTVPSGAVTCTTSVRVPV